MELSMREVMKKEKNMEGVDFAGQMDLFIKENLIALLFMEKELTSGLMVGSIKANGKKTRWTVRAFLFGRMEESMLDNIKTIKSMGILCKNSQELASSNGQKEKNIEVSGLMVNSTERVS